MEPGLLVRQHIEHRALRSSSRSLQAPVEEASGFTALPPVPHVGVCPEESERAISVAASVFGKPVHLHLGHTPLQRAHKSNSTW